MDDFVERPGTVDPEVRAYVYSLVSALGGVGPEGQYVLGDDALACLKDIKRWLKLFDEKTSSLDVARCLAEANLVKGDLLEILAAWPEDATEDRLKSKIALACLELLVPLTWPLERGELQMNANYHRHLPYLQLKQIHYKREVLEHWSSNILHTALRIAVPSIALPLGERTQRDEGIIKLVLYFLRNIVMITAPLDLPVEWNENEVSRSATVVAFQNQDVLALLLTMASNIGDDFNTQDVVILELLFHMLKGVEIEKLFLNDEELDAKSSKDLRGLMGKEADMLRQYSKNAPTRHNRFGTMIWVKRDDEKMSAVSGQEILLNSQDTLTKMDQTKRWNRPQRRRKEEPSHNHFDLPTPLTKSARKTLRSFVEEFLDSGFNPLFNHLRRAIEREASRILKIHEQQYFYVVSWFLEAERVRRRHRAPKRQRPADASQGDAGNYGVVASVLNQETFVVLNRFMESSLEHKEWHELSAGMRCFTQILLTVQEMSESKDDVDQEIAENIQNRIFYEESTHDRIVSILRGYKDQGFGYLDACTELSHVFIRMLERYSKENVDLQVRSKRRARKRKKAQQPSEDQGNDENADSEAEEVAEAQRTSKERKFDFNRLVNKFTTQNGVDTFIKFTTFYKELNVEQLKRAHRFFYRVAFKQDLSVMLFRLDILQLFHQMIKGLDHIPSRNPMFAEWEEFVKQLFRRLQKKLEARPELFVEVMFSKIPATAFFLEHGHEKQTIASKPRAPAELAVKGALTREEQIGVAVAVLHEEKMQLIEFVKRTLDLAAAERQSWQDEAAARAMEEQREGSEQPAAAADPPDITIRTKGEETRIAAFKDKKLRLLMRLAGLERVGEHDDPDAAWIVPSSLNAETLRETARLVERHRMDPVTHYGEEDPVAAEDMLTRKAQTRARRSAFDEDSGLDSDDFAEEEFAFPADAPTARRATALEELKTKRRKRQKHAAVDDATLEARQQARQRRERERRANIKSELYVHDSDDDEDAERDRAFFRSERDLQQRHAAKVVGLMQSHSARAVADRKRKGDGPERGARKRARQSDDGQSASASDEDDDGGVVGELPAEGVSSPSMHGISGLGLGTSEIGDSDTPMSSPADRARSPRSPRETNPKEVNDVVDTDMASNDEGIEGDAPVAEETSGDEVTTMRTSLDARAPRGEKGLRMDGQDVNDEDEDVAASRVRPGRAKHRATVIDSDDE